MKAVLFYLTVMGMLICMSMPLHAVPRDKVLHFSVSMSGQVTCAAIADEIVDKTAANVACAAAMLTAGALTEYGAVGSNTKSAKDMAANVAGVGLGALIVQWKF